MKTFKEVGESIGLTDDRLDIYVAYMRRRWADTEEQKCWDGYALEWAERFIHNVEFVCSDIIGQRILTELYIGIKKGGDK